MLTYCFSILKSLAVFFPELVGQFCKDLAFIFVMKVIHLVTFQSSEKNLGWTE